MDTSLPGMLWTMNTLTISTLPSSPYKDYPNFSFTNDIAASVTVDLDLTIVTKVSSCTQYPFIINPVS
jgi:hypothetical protein